MISLMLIKVKSFKCYLPGDDSLNTFAAPVKIIVPLSFKNLVDKWPAN